MLDEGWFVPIGFSIVASIYMDRQSTGVPNGITMADRAAGTAMIPESYARGYLEQAPSLLWLIGANLVAVLVGVRFYVEDMVDVPTFLWPLYIDSGVAVLLMALSLTTLLPFLGGDVRTATTNRVLAYLHTIAFVWLVKFGLWTVAVLLIGWEYYFPAAWAFFGIIITHLLFVVQAYLIPHYGRTTRGALFTALGLALLNDVVDYGLEYHPPMEYDPGLGVAAMSVGLTVLAVVLADRAFDRFASEETTSQLP